MLSPTEVALIVIIVVTFLVILSNRLPVELVALIVLLVLGFSGIVTPEQALSGFSSSVVIVLIGLFVITRALEETGVIQAIAQRLNHLGKGSEVRLIVLFMGAGATLSLVMNNVAAGAVLLPAAVRVAQFSNVRVSKLLIPMSFGTLVGGMATYLTTANIVMSELLRERGMQDLGMLDFIPTGGLIVVAGLVYMILIGRRLLPDRESITRAALQPNLEQTYQLEERMWEVRVLPDSRLANMRLSESGIGEVLGLTVLAIWHGRQAVFSPPPDRMIYPGDFLLVLGRQERVQILLEWGAALRGNGLGKNHQHDFSVDLVEAVIPPRSQAIGQTLTQLKFRQQRGLTAVAIWRGGRSYRTDVGKMPLEVGDALLVVGPQERIRQLANDDGNFMIPASGYRSRPVRTHKSVFALVITTIVLLVAIFDVLPLPEVMLAGAVAMVLSGCLKMPEFYNAVEWRVIFLIAGILPLSIAISQSGLADRIGALLVNALAGGSPLVLIGGMFLLAMLVTQIIGGQVTALLIGPVAINAALQMQVSPQAMAVAVAIGCSTAFLTPIAHPVNILMMGPGGYNFSDFFKIGLGMTLVTLLTLMLGMALLWGQV